MDQQGGPVQVAGEGRRLGKDLGIEFEGFTWPDRFVATNIEYPFRDFGFANANMVVDPVNWCVIGRLGREIPDEWYEVPAFYRGMPDTVIGPGETRQVFGSASSTSTPASRSIATVISMCGSDGTGFPS